LIVAVGRERETWEIRTAYRALRYAFVNMPLPMDPFSRKSRRVAAEKRARRKMLNSSEEDGA